MFCELAEDWKWEDHITMWQSCPKWPLPHLLSPTRLWDVCLGGCWWRVLSLYFSGFKKGHSQIRSYLSQRSEGTWKGRVDTSFRLYWFSIVTIISLKVDHLASYCEAKSLLWLKDQLICTLSSSFPISSIWLLNLLI